MFMYISARRNSYIMFFEIIFVMSFLQTSETTVGYIFRNETTDWFNATEYCTSSNGQLVESSQILELDILSESFVWVNQLAEYTHFVRNEGCYEPQNNHVTLTPIFISGTNKVVSCLERCDDSYVYALKGFSCYCITAEQYLMFSRTNTSSCDTSCPGDARDICGGKNATSFYKEVKNTVFASTPGPQINTVECAYGIKNTDFFDLRSSGCREKADGYMCETCIYGNQRCNTTAIQLLSTWYEADEDCRSDGGHLGDQYSISGYRFLEDGAYWLGLRRWIVDRKPQELSVLPPESCVACRIVDRKLQCDYKDCSEPLQYACVIPHPMPCHESEFTCTNGDCIPLSWKCDSIIDCADKSDENDCDAPCLEGQFTCTNGDCIGISWRCDTESDCKDGSDEKDCTSVKRNCKEDEFQCTDNTCIPLPWKCDNEADCNDRSDEQNCFITTEAQSTVYTSDTDLSTVTSTESTTDANNTLKSITLPGDKNTTSNSMAITIGSIALAAVVVTIAFFVALVFVIKSRQLKKKSNNKDLLNNIDTVHFERQRSFSNPAFMESEVAVVRTQSNRFEQAQEIAYEPVRCEKGSIQQTGNASSTVKHTGISNDYVSIDLKRNRSNAISNSDHNKNVNNSSNLSKEYMSMSLAANDYKDMTFKTSPQKDQHSDMSVQQDQQAAAYTEMEFGSEPQKEWYTEMTFNTAQERDYSNVPFNNKSQQPTYTDMTFKDPHQDAYAECPIVK